MTQENDAIRVDPPDGSSSRLSDDNTPSRRDAPVTTSRIRFFAAILFVGWTILIIICIYMAVQINSLDRQLQTLNTQSAIMLTGTIGPAITPTPTLTMTPQRSCYGTILSVRVPLREDHDRHASYEHVVDYNRIVEILSVLSTNDWYYVRYEGYYGWVFSTSIDPSESCSNIPTVDP